MSAPVIVDKIGLIVINTAKALYTDAAAINYMHGHPLEITWSLTKMTQNPTASAGKYPLIALFQDFEEVMDGDFLRLRLNLIIATLTEKTLLSSERYARSFIPTLYPIYDRFIYDLSRSGFFQESSVRDIKHTKIDRLFWGRNGLYGNEGNVFNDFIDCIELKDLKLSYKLKKC